MQPPQPFLDFLPEFAGNFYHTYIGIGYVLTPAYDMISSALVVKGDEEELALNLHGKKRKLQRKDFDAVLTTFKILEIKAIENMYAKFEAVIAKWINFIPMSFNDKSMQERYISLIQERAEIMKLFR